MLTFRRTALVALAVLALFLLFGGRNSLAASRVFRDRDLEKRLQAAERNTEAALRDLQKSTSEHAEWARAELRRLQTEKRNLEKQVQELRRLPDDVGVYHQLAYQFPYAPGHEKFPAYVWQTWKVGFDDPALDEGVRQNFESWRHNNDGFVHEVLTDAEARQLIRHLYMNVPAVVEAYEAMPEEILRADFFRYLILLARGGTYSDVDTEALKPVPVWIPASMNPLDVGLIVGIEVDALDRPDWNEWYARPLQFVQWTIASKPGHPILRDIVANITEQTLQRKHTGTLAMPNDWGERGTRIMDWTGPGVWTDLVFKYFNQNPQAAPGAPVIDGAAFAKLTQPLLARDVLVLPITSFSPGIEAMGAQGINDPLAFVHHKFQGSWK